MTGAEHYREAETLLQQASYTRGINRQPVDSRGGPITEAERTALIARANAHATLALAAAMADVWSHVPFSERSADSSGE